MRKLDLSFFALTEQYPDESSAESYFEKRRWSKGTRCSSCGSGNVFRGTQPMRQRQVWHCRDCRAQFSVTSGTVMESTKLPLRKWLYGFHLMGASKKGISALQLSRMLGISYRTAWHMSHRIREAMSDDVGRLFSGIVETDETYIGGRPRGPDDEREKVAVQTIVERNRALRKGQAKSFVLANSRPDGRSVGAKLRKHTRPERTILMTDDSPIYDALGENFAEHHVVNHSKRVYSTKALDGHIATTNTAEGYFANLKRQIGGTHHHTSKKHLGRYLAEHDFKYNTRDDSDTARADAAAENIEGRSLTLFKSRRGKRSLYDRDVDKG